ncbi:MAG: NAD(P)-dependent oxidoreductase [Bacteroidales bacterium]|nr:NAD(P)-dependent oxidoreductase [Candidatus Liminaster caballi]
MKILVTGASGFVGSHVVHLALKLGHEVWAAVRKTSSRQWLTDPGIRFVDFQEISEITDTFDAVIWCAGITKALKDEEFETVNYFQMRKCVEAMRQSGHLPRIFVYMSSLSARYPVSAYGRSKLHAAEWLREQKDMTVVILYPTGVYGPRDRDYLQQFRMIKSGFDFVPSLWGQQKLSFIYVWDLANIVFQAISVAEAVLDRCGACPVMEMDVSEPRTYTNAEFRHILQHEFAGRAGDKRWPVLPLRVPGWFIHLVCGISGLIAKMRHKPALLNPDKAHLLTQMDWTADNTQLRYWLGDNIPFTSLQNGVRLTTQYYLDNGWL